MEDAGCTNASLNHCDLRQEVLVTRPREDGDGDPAHHPLTPSSPAPPPIELLCQLQRDSSPDTNAPAHSSDPSDNECLLGASPIPGQECTFNGASPPHPSEETKAQEIADSASQPASEAEEEAAWQSLEDKTTQQVTSGAGSKQDSNNSTISSRHSSSAGDETESYPNGTKQSPKLHQDNLSLRSSDLEFEEEWASCNHVGRVPEVEKLEIQLEIVETKNKVLQKENLMLQERVAHQDTEFQKQMAQKAEQLEKLKQQLEQSQRERDRMVVKYAQGEQELMRARKQLEEGERRYRDLVHQMDQHLTKIRTLQQDKSRLSSTLDIRVADISNLQKENERLKGEISSRDIKIKWGLNKLKTETEAHKECQTRLDAALLRQRELREELEQVRINCQEMVRHLQNQAAENRHSEDLDQLVRQELESYKKRFQESTEENNQLTIKIHTLEKERLEREQGVSRLKEQLDGAQQEGEELRDRLGQLELETERAQSLGREVERLRAANADLQADMEACRTKEGELLHFTERLTSKTVQLQSDHALLESKNLQCKEENQKMARRCLELETRCRDLTAQLDRLSAQKTEEVQLLIHRLAEKTKYADQLTTKLEDAENEARILKRRHLASIKELSRELQHSRHKLEAAGALGSRTSSLSSLDTSPPPATDTKQQEIRPSTNNSISLPQIDQQTLVERIVRLQKQAAKKSEKLEFYQEHVAVLVTELKKKSKIIQSYVLREETGALASGSMDSNKLDMVRKGGVMASLYASHPADSALTLELSLEINSKLQAVLEDILLKNITLKENINTLGQEIARLSVLSKNIEPQQ